MAYPAREVLGWRQQSPGKAVGELEGSRTGTYLQHPALGLKHFLIGNIQHRRNDKLLAREPKNPSIRQHYKHADPLHALPPLDPSPIRQLQELKPDLLADRRRQHNLDHGLPSQLRVVRQLISQFIV